MWVCLCVSIPYLKRSSAPLQPVCLQTWYLSINPLAQILHISEMKICKEIVYELSKKRSIRKLNVNVTWKNRHLAMRKKNAFVLTLNTRRLNTRLKLTKF